jgi:hypothetical protein
MFCDLVNECKLTDTSCVCVYLSVKQISFQQTEGKSYIISYLGQCIHYNKTRV